MQLYMNFFCMQREEPVVTEDSKVPKGAETESETVNDSQKEVSEEVDEAVSPDIKTPPPKPAPLLTVDGK